MSEEVQEELNIIEEREKESEPNIELALSINEPIEKMLYRDPVLVSKETKVADAISLFNEKDVGCVLVVENKTGKLIGIFTERDVIRKIVHKGYDVNEPIEKFMTKHPDALKLSDPIAYALNRMAAGGYRHVPLVDGNRVPVGFLSIRDVVDHLADYYSNKILNLPPSTHARQRTPEGG